MEKFRGAFAKDAKMHKILEKQVLPYLGASASTTSDDDDDDDDIFGEESFQDDEDLKEILTSISNTTDED
jgi:hypothetical protein